MSLIQEVKEMEKEITCSVCKEHYTEPKILPCLHYFCKECVLKLDLRTASKEPFFCPECRTKIFLPEGGVEKLKTAFFINRFKSNFLALKKVHSKINVKCEGCNSRAKAEAFCRQCAVFICENCVISHKKSKCFSHEVVSLEDLKKGPTKQIVAVESAANMCTIHEKQLLIYCFNCNSLICHDCAVTTHKEHKHALCKEAALEIKRELVGDLVPFKEVSAKLINAVDEICTTKHEIEVQGTSVICKIENSFEELHHILEKQKQQLMQEASMKVQEKIKKLSAQEKELCLANADIQHTVEYTKRLVEHGSDNEVLSMQTDIRRQIYREMNEHSQLCGSFKPVEEPDIEADVKCGEALQQLCQTHAKITKLSPDPSHYIVKGEGAKSAEVHQTAYVSLTAKTSEAARHKPIVVSYIVSLYDKSVMKCRVEQQMRGEFTIHYTPTIRGRHELIVSLNGQQVAGSPFSVYVSISPTQLGEPVKVWREVYRPRGITVNSENDIIVAEEKGDIIKLSKACDKKVILVKHSQTKLVELESVATDNEDNIYCSDFESNRVMRCDKNGENIQVFEVQQVAGPGHYGVKIIGDEVMLCERKHVGKIMIYDKELKYKRCIQHDSFGGMFKYVSVDIDGNLFVTDYHNGCIHVFSNASIFQFSFYCRSNRHNDVDGPRYASVSGQYIYVTNTIGDSISVFTTTTGEYVTSFGHRGYDEGNFNNPCCVCVDNDSFVLVTDCSNDRVLCF